MNGANKPGPRIVRAWFDTIVNPLLIALGHERGFLADMNWTWRHRQETLEYVRQIPGYLSFAGESNLGLFLEFNADLQELIKSHDLGVAKLIAACKAFHAALKNAFVGIGKPVLATTEAVADLQTCIPAFLKTHGDDAGADLLAQYTINHLKSLPQEYTTATFWNEHQTKFLAFVRNTPQMRSLDQRCVEVGVNLRAEVEVLLDGLNGRRRELSLQHDVPFYSSPNPGAANEAREEVF